MLSEQIQKLIWEGSEQISQIWNEEEEAVGKKRRDMCNVAYFTSIHARKLYKAKQMHFS